jgi:hypothetical protein
VNNQRDANSKSGLAHAASLPTIFLWPFAISRKGKGGFGELAAQYF